MYLSPQPLCWFDSVNRNKNKYIIVCLVFLLPGKARGTGPVLKKILFNSCNSEQDVKKVKQHTGMSWLLICTTTFLVYVGPKRTTWGNRIQRATWTQSK